MARKRKSRRVKYYPVEVVRKILNNEVLLAMVNMLLNESMPLPCGEIARRLSKIFNKEFTTGYVNALLRKLERWGIARPYRSPFNGHLLWTVADTKTVDLLLETIRKREAEKLIETVGVEL